MRSPRRTLYVYAIVSGRPRSRVLAGLPALPDGSIPRAVRLDDEMSLVVADVPSELYNPAALEPRLGNSTGCRAAARRITPWPTRSPNAHRRALRLFTLFSSEAKAIATLRKPGRAITKALERVKDRRSGCSESASPILRAGRARSTCRLDDAQRAGPCFSRQGPRRGRRPRRNTRVARRSAAAVFDDPRAWPIRLPAPDPPGTNLLLDAAFLVTKRAHRGLQQTLTDAAAGLLRDGCRSA